jgi:hypothetical protein
MTAAHNWSLFDRQVHDAHFAALRQLYQAGDAAGFAPPQLPAPAMPVTKR